MDLLWSIAVGIFVGYLGNRFYGGKNADKKGWFIYLLLGLAGGVVGGFVFGLLGLSTSSLIGDIISGAVGAAIILFIWNLLRKK